MALPSMTGMAARSADIAQAQHGGAVADHGYCVAFNGIGVNFFRVGGDGLAGSEHAR